MSWKRKNKLDCKLPEGNVLISFSGGRTSGFMLHQILKNNGDLPDRCKVVFANTGREMPETLDFVEECSSQWSVPIIWLEYRKAKPKFEIVSHNSASRDGKPFEDAIAGKTGNAFLPNQAIRYCTQEMKVLTIKRYLVAHGWKRWTNTVGIRSDEAHRLKASKDKRWQNWFPLSKGYCKRDVNAFWSSNSFDLRVTKGFGNCDGCFLKSEAQLAALKRDHPDRFQWWSNMEARCNGQFHKLRSYDGLGRFVSAQKDWIFDLEGALCQKDDGECTI